MVADELSRVSMDSVAHMVYDKKESVKEVYRFARLGVRLEDSPKSGFVVFKNSESSLVIGVKSKQHLNPLLMELKETIFTKSNESFSQGEDGLLRH